MNDFLKNTQTVIVFILLIAVGTADSFNGLKIVVILLIVCIILELLKTKQNDRTTDE